MDAEQSSAHGHTNEPQSLDPLTTALLLGSVGVLILTAISVLVFDLPPFSTVSFWGVVLGAVLLWLAAMSDKGRNFSDSETNL